MNARLVGSFGVLGVFLAGGPARGQPAPIVPPRPPVIAPVSATVPIPVPAALLPKVPAPPAAKPLPVPPPALIPSLPTLPDARPLPAVPPPPGLAPPAPPANSAPPTQPGPPAGPDSSLRAGYGGNSVKPEPPAVPASRPADPAPDPRPVEPPPEAAPTPPGDTPMTLKQTATAALIGGALALSQPGPAAAQDKKTVEERLTEIDKKLDALTQALKGGRKDSDGYPIPLDKGLIEDVKTLKTDLAALRTEVEGMKKTTALRPQPADPMAGKGTVRIENNYPVEVTVVVNAGSYRVPAGTKLDVPVPTGEFTYQLLSSLDPVTQRGTVEEKKVATLRVK